MYIIILRGHRQISGAGTSNYSTSTPWMNSRIWSKLPQRLLDRVIAFLPPPAFFRARCVCKRWYALLFSNTFLELYLQVSPHQHWFLFFKHHKTRKSYIYKNNNNGTSGGCGHHGGAFEGYLFDPYEMAWYRISFTFSSPSSSSQPSSFYFILNSSLSEMIFSNNASYLLCMSNALFLKPCKSKFLQKPKKSEMLYSPSLFGLTHIRFLSKYLFYINNSLLFSFNPYQSLPFPIYLIN